MVFARYVMFSEVYWHHGVRSATAMLQRAFEMLKGRLVLEELYLLGEQAWIGELVRAAGGEPAAELLDGLFGPRRRLYKRLVQYGIFDAPDVYRKLRGRPYRWLTRCAERFAASASRRLGREIAPHEIIFDAPPARREVQFDVDIFFAKERRYRPLGEVSPVVRVLAEEQFDDCVKRVRVFAHPDVLQTLLQLDDTTALIERAVDETERREVMK
jgi:HD superfamily phosphohydrolase